jgi:hypothetical protein
MYVESLRHKFSRFICPALTQFFSFLIASPYSGTWVHYVCSAGSSLTALYVDTPLFLRHSSTVRFFHIPLANDCSVYLAVLTSFLLSLFMAAGWCYALARISSGTPEFSRILLRGPERLTILHFAGLPPEAGAITPSRLDFDHLLAI